MSSGCAIDGEVGVVCGGIDEKPLFVLFRLDIVSYFMLFIALDIFKILER